MSYFFDCADGLYARTYNMTTQFGDIYDHSTDVIVFFGIAITVMQEKEKTNNTACSGHFIVCLASLCR